MFVDRNVSYSRGISRSFGKLFMKVGGKKNGRKRRLLDMSKKEGKKIEKLSKGRIEP